MRGTEEAFAEKFSNYTVQTGSCAGSVNQSQALYLSRVTCRYLCGENTQCAAVEYHHGNLITDDYCHLVSKPIACRESDVGDTELHLKLQ